MGYLEIAKVVIALLPWAGCGVLFFMWKTTKERFKAERLRGDKLELNLNAMNADNRRKNAALITIRDNMEKLKSEKTRILKSDIDGLIGVASELSDDSGDTGSGDGGDSADLPPVISGTLI